VSQYDWLAGALFVIVATVLSARAVPLEINKRKGLSLDGRIPVATLNLYPAAARSF
jgi:hypothetical protein